MCESAILKLRHLFHLVGLKNTNSVISVNKSFQFIFSSCLNKCFLTNYGLFGGTLHLKIVCFKESRSLGWHWSYSVWVLDCKNIRMPILMPTLLLSLPILCYSLNCTWSTSISLRTQSSTRFACRKVQHRSKGVKWRGPLASFWLAGLSGSHRHLSKRAEGLMKGCCHFTGGEQKSEACKACAENCGAVWWAVQ